MSLRDYWLARITIDRWMDRIQNPRFRSFINPPDTGNMNQRVRDYNLYAEAILIFTILTDGNRYYLLGLKQ